MMTETLITRLLGLQDYQTCWQAMKQFTNQRNQDTLDEIWLLEHPAIFTQGQNGKPEHLLQTSAIPLVQTDRGGQITYHGPGQLIVYLLIDIKRKNFTIREFVTQLETSVIMLLQTYQIEAFAKKNAPGVYVNEEKICSLGLRVRRGCTYHGLALNIAMDLTPFSFINPCGYSGLKATQLATFNNSCNIQQTGLQLVEYLAANLGYTNNLIQKEPSLGI